MTRRQTIQKQAVLTAVRSAQPSHPTAADVFALVRPAVPTLAIGTVYRVLHGLAEEGEIQEIPHSSGPTRYDADTTPHHHVICTVCGTVGDVRLCPEFMLHECARPQTAFQVDGYQLEFQGRCPNCLDRDRSSSTDDAQREQTNPC